MFSTILLIVLLFAHITDLISEQLLNATVGGSILIPCSLPGYPLTFFWQEGKKHFFHWENGTRKEAPNEKYQNRSEIFSSEFSSGNFSFRLDNISLEDDQKTFFAYVKLDEQKPSEQHCRSTLQVSAPYQHLNLTVNNTTNIATCSAQGGYPAAQVSWKGQNRSNDEQLDLQDAETFLQQDPTEKTFSFTSSVNATGLKSVTCFIYNPHSNKTINKTVELVEIDPGENWRHHFVLIAAFAPFILVILILAGVIVGLYWRYKRPPPAPAQDQDQDQDQDPANQPLVESNTQDGAQAEAEDQDPDPPNEPPVEPNAQEPAQEEAPAPAQEPDPPNELPVDPNAQDGAQDEASDLAQDPDPPNEPPVEPKPQDRAQTEDADAAEPAQDPVQKEAADDEPEAAVLPSQNKAVFHRHTRSKGTADSDTDEDAAASPEKEKLLENEKGNEVSTSD